jgi:hypothetical protein
MIKLLNLCFHAEIFRQKIDELPQVLCTGGDVSLPHCEPQSFHRDVAW